MSSISEKFLCMDCRVDTVDIGELYYVHDAVWLSVVPLKEGMLCVRCFERRLERQLHAADFMSVAINVPDSGTKSPLLISRLIAR